MDSLDHGFVSEPVRWGQRGLEQSIGKWPEETPESDERRTIAFTQSRAEIRQRPRGCQLQPADEHPDDVDSRWPDFERQNRVHDVSGKEVEDAGALFEP